MKDVNEMSLDEFDFYIQSQGFATSHKVADPQKVPEGVMSKADEKDVYRDMDERDDTDGFSPEYDAYEKARLDDEPTAAEFAEAEAEHDALMNSVPDYDEEAARDADDVRRETDHEKSVEKEASPAAEKPWFMRNEAETARSAEHEHDHDR